MMYDVFRVLIIPDSKHFYSHWLVFINIFISRFLFQFDPGKCLFFVYPSKLLKKVFGVIVFLQQFFIPLIILVFCYGKIVWILSRRLDFNTNSGKSQSDKFQLAGTNTIKTMFIVALFFVICLSNTQVYFLMTNLGYEVDWNSQYIQFTMVMSFLNCTINPFTYPFKYQDFHKDLKKSLGCVKFKNVKELETRGSTITTSVLDKTFTSLLLVISIVQ